MGLECLLNLGIHKGQIRKVNLPERARVVDQLGKVRDQLFQSLTQFIVLRKVLSKASSGQINPYLNPKNRCYLDQNRNQRGSFPRVNLKEISLKANLILKKGRSQEMVESYP